VPAPRGHFPLVAAVEGEGVLADQLANGLLFGPTVADRLDARIGVEAHHSVGGALAVHVEPGVTAGDL